ncbi:hypothetical protein OG315_00105 [Streptomyces atratus]|nr:hypothetical protein [Streptomyces atratus]
MPRYRTAGVAALEPRPQRENLFVAPAYNRDITDEEWSEDPVAAGRKGDPIHSARL